MFAVETSHLKNNSPYSNSILSGETGGPKLLNTYQEEQTMK